MSETQWTIGADPSVDIWVDHPDVSGLHCRLLRTAGGYVVEDLQSTNGTFCNGQRIESRQVSPSDRIELARRVPMPWPDRSLAREVILIGYDASSRYRITDESVSGRHAELMVDCNGQFIICDLGSSNGTWVGPQSIKAALLQPNDVFRVGVVAVTPQQIVQQLAPSHPVGQSRLAGLASTFSVRTMLLLAGVPMLVGIIGLFLVFHLVTPSSSTHADSQTGAGDDPQAVAKNENSGQDPAAHEASADDTILSGQSSLASSNKAAQKDASHGWGSTQPDSTLFGDQAPALTGLDRVREGVFFIVVNQDGVQFDFATAWAATSQLLITNAHVVDSIRGNGFSITVVHAASGTTIPVTDFGIHPSYENRVRELAELQSQVNELENSSPQSEREAEEAERQLRAKKLSIPWAARSVDAVDAGWIELEPASQKLSPVPRTTVPLLANQALKLANASILVAPGYAETNPGDQRNIEFARLRAVERVIQGDNDPARWAARFSAASDDWRDYLYDGCPIVDLRGRLVGMYRGSERRLTTGSSDTAAVEQTEDRFDMVPVSVIDEMIRELSTGTTE